MGSASVVSKRRWDEWNEFPRHVHQRGTAPKNWTIDWIERCIQVKKETASVRAYTCSKTCRKVKTAYIRPWCWALTTAFEKGWLQSIWSGVFYFLRKPISLITFNSDRVLGSMSTGSLAGISEWRIVAVGQLSCPEKPSARRPCWVAWKWNSEPSDPLVSSVTFGPFGHALLINPKILWLFSRSANLSIALLFSTHHCFRSADVLGVYVSHWVLHPRWAEDGCARFELVTEISRLYMSMMTILLLPQPLLLLFLLLAVFLSFTMIRTHSHNCSHSTDEEKWTRSGNWSQSVFSQEKRCAEQRDKIWLIALRTRVKRRNRMFFSRNGIVR